MKPQIRRMRFPKRLKARLRAMACTTVSGSQGIRRSLRRAVSPERACMNKVILGFGRCRVVC